MSIRLGLYEKAMPTGLTFEQMLGCTAESGFDYMELSIDETEARQSRLDWNETEKRELINAIKNTGVPITSICLSAHRKYPLGSRDESTRSHGVDILKKAVLFAQCFGVRIIQLAGYDVYYERSGDDTRKWFMDGLRAGVDFAAAYGVSLGFETMETPFMDTVSKSVEYVNALSCPFLGVYPDLGNLTNACRIYGTCVVDELEAGRGHLLAMHVKETRAGQYRDMRFGTGSVDFASGIAKAISMGVRLFVAEFWHDGKPDWKTQIQLANRFIRKKVSLVDNTIGKVG